MSRLASARPAQRPLSGAPDVSGGKIGILAGGGRLPAMIAESVLARGGSVHIVGIEGEADADIARFPHTWVNWGQLGRMVATLQSERAGVLVIAGGVRRPNLWKLRPDLGLVRSLPQILKMLAGGDDSVLSRVVRLFEVRGIEVRGAHEVAPELLAGDGPAGALPLDRQARADAELGFAVRTALAPLDAGQAVVIADGRVLAIEGAEGTDAMLRRVAGLRETGGTPRVRSGVLAKGPKPGQELRVDMPTIGPRTVALAADAGLAGVAVEAGATLLLDRAEAVAAADARGIAVEGLPKVPATSPRTAAPAEAAAAIRMVGRLRPGARDAADIEKGLAAVARLAPFAAGRAVVVARAYILAISGGDTVLDAIVRTRALRQWGVGAKRRIGVLALRASPAGWTGHGIEEILNEAAAAGLAGVVVTGPLRALTGLAPSGAAAARHGLFLATREEQP
jgi:DUF1009 family protein